MWTSVDDMFKPKIGQEVLIRISVCRRYVVESAHYLGCGMFQGGWFDTFGEGTSYRVTHWAEMLPDPKEE